MIDLATVLYANLKTGDEVVWSKGWAAATIYYFLVQRGEISSDSLDQFPNPPFYGLAETSVPGVHVSGGAMGHGLPVAVGMAIGKKRAGEKGTIYCIMSDGEMQEETTWGAALRAAHEKLDNLVVIIDYNKWCAMGRTNEVLNLEPFVEKWKAFGWIVDSIAGHNFDEIDLALSENEDLPFVIIAHTIKGKGISFMEDHLLYHYKNISDEEYVKAVRELSWVLNNSP